MKKFVALVLALAMMLTAASALADLVICQNKVEITAQMEAYAKLYEEKTGVPVKVITGGGSSDYNTVLKSEMASGREPDIWVIEGPSGYELWKDKIADQAGAEWTQYTAAAYMDGDKVVGFPAFEKLDSMKAELGLDMVVFMVAGTTTGMTWVTGLHNFNVYLTVGNERNDTTYIDQVLEGKVDPERFHQYCQYVALIFKYSDPDMLLNGTQDSQLAAFANGKAAFYHQGNWMDPSLVALNPDFEIAYAPHAFLKEDTDGILVNPPSWYVVNENGNKDEAIAYLNYLATSEDGANYMVNEAKMVPAFTNVTLAPSTPLSKSVMEWNAAGKTYDWQQYKLPDGFGMGTLGQSYELFASGAIAVYGFEAMMIEAIAGIAK